MTFLEKYYEDLAAKSGEDPSFLYCPSTFDYEECWDCQSAGINCVGCWNREMPEKISESEMLVGMRECQKKLVGALMRIFHSCPLNDNANIDFEKECVGYREQGCAECILRHIDDLK